MAGGFFRREAVLPECSLTEGLVDEDLRMSLLLIEVGALKES